MNPALAKKLANLSKVAEEFNAAQSANFPHSTIVVNDGFEMWVTDHIDLLKHLLDAGWMAIFDQERYETVYRQPDYDNLDVDEANDSYVLLCEGLPKYRSTIGKQIGHPELTEADLQGPEFAWVPQIHAWTFNKKYLD